MASTHGSKSHSSPTLHEAGWAADCVFHSSPGLLKLQGDGVTSQTLPGCLWNGLQNPCLPLDAMVPLGCAMMASRRIRSGMKRGSSVPKFAAYARLRVREQRVNRRAASDLFSQSQRIPFLWCKPSRLFPQAHRHWAIHRLHDTNTSKNSRDHFCTPGLAHA